MFGLLHTGDSYKSQTEYLVSCTQTYLKLCYGSACEIYDLALQNKQLVSFLMIKRDGAKSPPRKLEKYKKTDKLEDEIQEMYEELVAHSCTTKLYATFSLESFINAFTTYLINQKILNNVQDEVKEVILHTISRLYDKLSTLDKWEEITHQFGQNRLNKSTVLWKRFCNLYNFRDNIVHDKPVFILRTGDAIKIKKGMIAPVRREEAEPSMIARYIHDAYQACKIHDDMIRKLYTITGISEEGTKTDFFVLPQNYHRKIKNVVKRLEELEQELRESVTPSLKPEGYQELM
ncbi:hypothetical protein [Candidatus Formimonas warabiya]|uniref:Uncharacterized protein n=1 Tax=Formimonas warabiya TaxID=1761012 RepID=A0A3G1KXT1_FORW1|nr:hypothetical protein [Candidatus Formimonas warabiya]ATW27266.1 hypothetical protein DCMF_23155 [Candidatus Formimonas warabiya]